ncbi:hypothetical protein ACS6L6_21730 [Enterobacter asburiae]|uniref:hypothetical protein n=1 Tax=Enterobacter asburiae TaxID=61645 RepID=UPI003F41BCAE
MRYKISQTGMTSGDAEDECYTKEQLRDVFRMKPAPGKAPARVRKNPYGGQYGVWRVADCVPMCEKHCQTEKQREASVQLGQQARLRGERGWLAMLVRKENSAATHAWSGQQHC